MDRWELENKIEKIIEKNCVELVKAGMLEQDIEKSKNLHHYLKF